MLSKIKLPHKAYLLVKNKEPSVLVARSRYLYAFTTKNLAEHASAYIESPPSMNINLKNVSGGLNEKLKQVSMNHLKFGDIYMDLDGKITFDKHSRSAYKILERDYGNLLTSLHDEELGLALIHKVCVETPKKVTYDIQYMEWTKLEPAITKSFPTLVKFGRTFQALFR